MSSLPAQVTPTECYSIDPEFAFYGPFSFDAAMFISSLILLYLALPGHATPDQPRDAQRTWLISCIKDTWTTFEAQVRELWVQHAAKGELYCGDVWGEDGGAGVGTLDRFIGSVWEEAVAFVGAFCIRRLIGMAGCRPVVAFLYFYF